MQIELNDNQLWYVKSAIHRGVRSLEESIAEAEHTIQNLSDDAPMRGTIVEMLTNMTSYNKQLLREMEQYIPEELNPK
jgi:hypothetical protein